MRCPECGSKDFVLVNEELGECIESGETYEIRALGEVH